MPFAGFENWEDCKNHNKSDELCGYLKNKFEKEIKEGHYMGRNVDPQYMNVILSRYWDLRNKGIPEDEIHRAIMSEFAYGSHFNDPWPPQITGIDIVDRIYPDLIPASAYPPKLDVAEQISMPSSLSRADIGANTVGGPSMHGEEPAINKRQMPEESYYPWKHIQEQEGPKYARYHYNGHEASEFCKWFDGKVFDVSKFTGRPVTPSENHGFTTQHPNCQCTWDEISPLIWDELEPAFLTGDQKSHLSKVNRIIGQKANHGTLHILNSDGSMGPEIDWNPRHMQETVGELKQQFRWLSPDYVGKIKQLNAPGRFFLIRAAAESITDHRGEGEPYPRHLTGMELVAMARTATGKGMDINHNPAWKTPAVIVDSEGDPDRKEIQMIVYESDPEIIQAVDNGILTAVSINGGAPRTNDVECTDQCYLVPRGVILGELDGIALTYVVTDPRGFQYHGQVIPPAEPGVKVTKIESL